VDGSVLNSQTGYLKVFYVNSTGGQELMHAVLNLEAGMFVGLGTAVLPQD
jgi:hypothetical protein